MGDFNWKIYRELNPDLGKNGFKTEKQLIHHWNIFGKNEMRISKVNDITCDFNWETYKRFNDDLEMCGIKSKIDIEFHWIKHGINEGRKYKENENIINIDNNFNWKVYKDLNIDLRRKKFTEANYKQHYIENKNDVKRLKTVYDLYPDFDPIKYLEYNDNLRDIGIINNYDLEEHWVLYGRKQGLIYKKEQETIASFHVLIATIGRKTLNHILRSLIPQLSVIDFLTIVYDGPETTQNIGEIESLIKKFKCKINIIIEPVNLGYWGHSIRNKYNNLKGDFIMHGDDDDFYPPNIFDKLRKICNNKDSIYIFKFEGYDMDIFSEEFEHGTIGTPSGVIPMKYNDKSEWKFKYGGDCLFYSGLESKYGEKFIFVPEYIYTVRNTSKLIWNWEIYKLVNPYLNLPNNEAEYTNHWVNIGYKDGLPFQVTDIYIEFKWENHILNKNDTKLTVELRWLNDNIIDWHMYRELNADLLKLTKEKQIMEHWYNCGYKEKRMVKVTDLTPDFDWKAYNLLNEDLGKAGLIKQCDIELHWVRHGIKEGRKYRLN